MALTKEQMDEVRAKRTQKTEDSIKDARFWTTPDIQKIYDLTRNEVEEILATETDPTRLRQLKSGNVTKYLAKHVKRLFAEVLDEEEE